MSKSALGHMTKGHALEWGEHGVRVNGLAPGFILTDLTQKLWSQEQMQEWGLTNTPQKRLGTPEDMVGTALFLASKASAFLTGQDDLCGRWVYLWMELANSRRRRTVELSLVKERYSEDNSWARKLALGIRD